MRSLRIFAATAATMLASATLTIAAAPTAAAATTCSERDYLNIKGGYRAAIPATSSYSYNCILREGNRGPAVKALQDSLAICNYGKIERDGIFGPKTTAALKKAQSAAKVSADGVYGPKTRDSIKWAWINKSNVKCGVMPR
ncbi:peptidoglycan-binding protein [Streptomyces durbertensis]|uniref:Peptidoglycan-binding protein n=1 Tax=Streptomyces durbertensis TaxID=2448886 RepID=A0ABR6EGZ6_9ACTN|nr:peptidoglycan-binding domain-containing protein [Streptomyces durbertensis]MBB1243779.1 peptidoglycan-binding protein [Streptomyces durbertensis]